MTAIVLAGGKKSLTNEIYPHLPTALIPVAEQPFVYWLSKWIKHQGFSQIVYTTGKHTDKMSAWAHQQATIDLDVCFDVLGESRPLGTGGATLLATLRFPAELFLVVNGDSLLLTNLNNHVRKLKDSEDLDGILVGTMMNNAGRFGNLVVNENNQLIAFNEKQPGKGLVNVGVYLLKQHLFENLEADVDLSLEYDCFPSWIKQGRKFEVITVEFPFIDIGTPESLAKARDLMKPYKEQLLTA